MGEYLFKTEDGVEIFTGQYGYWLGYRNGKWVLFGTIKAHKFQASLLVGDNIINKVFSTSELAKEFYLKSNEIKCIGRWTDLPSLPEKVQYQYFMGIDIGPNKKTLNTITVCVSHISGTEIIYDYLKTLMLENKFEMNRNEEINNLVEEISGYFDDCVIYTEGGKTEKIKTVK